MRPIITTVVTTLLTLVTLAVLGTPGAFAADLGDECKIGSNVHSDYICPFGTSCLKAISKRYCSHAGKACGWSGENGYNVGKKKTHQGKSYECTMDGFKRTKAQLGERCKTGMNVARHYLCEGVNQCRQAIDRKYCSQPGKICGWSGTGGYNLGNEKTYQGKSYECTPTGFQRTMAQLGEECKTGANVPREFLCEGVNLCRPAISKEYCTQPGKVCGWSGTGGYALGHTRTHQGKKYDCTPTGFERQTATYQVGNVTTLPASPKIRGLTSAEIAVARSVFQNSVNLGQVRLTNTVGARSKPWTTNTPPVYTVNIGVGAYKGMASRRWSGLLIHELAHVWQGQHGIPFMANSGLHQTLAAIQNGGRTGAAYDYKPGKQWKEYSSEQQASIIEDWFRDGRKSSSPLYPYIRDNVRPGKPNAKTRFQQRGRR